VIEIISSTGFSPVRLQPAHLRAGRALLGWSAEVLAQAATIGVATVRRAEMGDERVTYETKAALVAALQNAGVVFLDEEGEGLGVFLRAPAREDAEPNATRTSSKRR
jgi:transcriptional regulator with XRE-family HTH domain